MGKNNRISSIKSLAFRQRYWSDVTRVKLAKFVTYFSVCSSYNDVTDIGEAFHQGGVV